jgi:hypothetical protein
VPTAKTERLCFEPCFDDVTTGPWERVRPIGHASMSDTFKVLFEETQDVVHDTAGCRPTTALGLRHWTSAQLASTATRIRLSTVCIARVLQRAGTFSERGGLSGEGIHMAASLRTSRRGVDRCRCDSPRHHSQCVHVTVCKAHRTCAMRPMAQNTSNAGARAGHVTSSRGTFGYFCTEYRHDGRARQHVRVKVAHSDRCAVRNVDVKSP